MRLSAMPRLLIESCSKLVEEPVSYVPPLHEITVKLTHTQVLLFVYVLYLLFQLKSHAYMYESTPQHLIDEESRPGVLAEMLNSSSSSSDSSSDSDSDGSSGSNTTAKRIKRAIRRKRRKSSVSSRDTPSLPSAQFPVSPPSNISRNQSAAPCQTQRFSPEPSHSFDTIVSGDEADVDGKGRRTPRRSTGIDSRDFEVPQSDSTKETPPQERKRTKKHKGPTKSKRKMRTPAGKDRDGSGEQLAAESESKDKQPATVFPLPPRVNIVTEAQEIPDPCPKRPSHFRDLSQNALPRAFSPGIFSQPSAAPNFPAPRLLGVPNINPNIRRTTSMPEMSNAAPSPIIAPVSTQPLPHLMPSNQQIGIVDPKGSDGQKPLSRTSAVLLLLAVTALVAVCAEFLVDSIDYLVEETGVSQAFIGLIILPIVGNAAEHVTAVTVASKNKMDLAIGVALGSSIQIAIFVTPLIVLLGWCLQRDMSLYFSLFETVSLFASAFIVNYLMIDGRSNYLEGALLIAAYVIIALAAFFYPSCENLSEASGLAPGNGSSCH